MRNPLMALCERAFRRTDVYRKMMADLEAARIDNEINSAILKAAVAQARTTAKAEIIDDLRTALEASRG